MFYFHTYIRLVSVIMKIKITMSDLVFIPRFRSHQQYHYKQILLGESQLLVRNMNLYK